MARKKTKEEREHDLLLANVREVMATRQGKEVMWHILSMSTIYSDAFTGDNTTFYNEGKRAIGLQILELLDETDPALYARLILDQQKTEGNKDARTRNSDGTYDSVGTDPDD